MTLFSDNDYRSRVCAQRSVLLLGLVGVLGVSGCAAKPWIAHSTTSAKPPSPLHAAADQGLLVVFVNSPQGAGNGSYTVFERDGGKAVPLAQIDETLAAWTTHSLTPGRHQLYVRTWASAFCVRLDAEVVAGKIYGLGLNYTNNDRAGLLGSNGNIYPRAAFTSTVAGPLNFHPYVALDEAGARAELAEHASQVDECTETADKGWAEAQQKSTGIRVYTAGLDQIEFATK